MRAVLLLGALLLAGSSAALAKGSRARVAQNLTEHTIPGITGLHYLVASPEGSRVFVRGHAAGRDDAFFSLPVAGGWAVQLTDADIDPAVGTSLYVSADGAEAVIAQAMAPRRLQYVFVRTDGSANRVLPLPTGLRVGREWFSAEGTLYVWAWRPPNATGPFFSDRVKSVLLAASRSSAGFSVVRGYVKHRFFAFNLDAEEKEGTFGECGQDGSRIILGRLDADAGKMRYVRTPTAATPLTGGETDCSISGNGRTVVLTVRWRDGRTGLIANVAGRLISVPLLARDKPHNFAIASVAHDGSRVYLNGGGDYPGTKQPARVVYLPSGRVRKVRNPPLQPGTVGDALEGSQSPDGRFIVGKEYVQNGSKQAIRITDTRSFAFKRVYTGQLSSELGWLWSPDSKHVLVSFDYPSPTLISVRSDGTRRVSLDPHNLIDWLWSSGGGRMRTAESRIWLIGSGRDRLYSVPAAGFGEEPLLP